MEKLVDEITNWMKESLKSFNGRSFVVHMTGGIDTTLAAVLSAKTGVKTTLVYTYYRHKPFSYDRVAKLVYNLKSDYEIEFLEVDLSNSIHNVLAECAAIKPVTDPYQCKKVLSTTLTTPLLDYVSKMTEGLIVSGHNKDEDFFLRTYHRRGSGSSDLYPLGDLHKSEIYNVSKYLGIPKDFMLVDSTASSVGGDPTNPRRLNDEVLLSSEDIEWAQKECEAWAKEIGLSFEEIVNSKRKFFEVEYGQTNALEKYPYENKRVLKKIIELEYESRYKNNTRADLRFLKS